MNDRPVHDLRVTYPHQHVWRLFVVDHVDGAPCFQITMAVHGRVGLHELIHDSVVAADAKVAELRAAQYGA